MCFIIYVNNKIRIKQLIRKLQLLNHNSINGINVTTIIILILSVQLFIYAYINIYVLFY